MKCTPPKFLFFVIQILLIYELNAQNLAPNPSFEGYTTCPTFLNQMGAVNDWYSPTATTPDFFHECGVYPVSIPVNLAGTQDALTGQAYTGIVAHHGSPIPDYREYIQAVLTEPLVAGYCYDLEMFTSPAETWPMFGISNVGMYLSTSPPTVEPNGQINVTPQVSYGNAIVDVNGWFPLTGTYTAIGGEQYITIGNFALNGTYDVQPLNPPSSGEIAAYYFIEDVRVELAQGGQEDVEATICEGECYEFEGEDYCMEGTYEIPVEGGCFSVINLTIYVDEFAIAAIDLPDTLDCNTTSIFLDASGSSSGPGVNYEWSGPNNYSSNQQNPEVFDPGMYTLTVSGTDLCAIQDSVIVIEEIIYPDISTEVSGLIDCNTLVVTLTGSSTTPNVTYHWTGPGIDSNSPTINTDQSGVYTLIITGSGGCTSSEEVMVEEDLDPPDISAEVQGTLDCDSPSALLVGSSTTQNVTYVWSGPGLNTNTPVALAEQPGDYTFAVVGPNGCVSTLIVTVIEEITILDIEATVDGMLDCENTTVTLTGSTNSQNVTYQWIGPGVFSDVPVVEANEPGQYTFSIVDDNGCTAETSVFVVQNIETPELIVNVPDTLNCIISSIDLDASNSNGTGIIEFEWQNENGDNLGNDPILNVTASGIYTLIITDEENGCTELSTIEVFEDTQEPTSTINSTGELDCQNELVTLDGSNSTGNPINFQWSDPDENEISMDTSIDVSVGGIYTLLVSNTSNGCTAVSTIEVEFNVDLPTAIAQTNDFLDCETTAATLDGDGSSEGINFSYEWQNTSGDSIANELQTIVDEPGIYTLIVFNNENGCSSTAIVELEQDIETPVAVAGDDQLITCDETEVMLDGSGSSIGSGNLTFVWINSNGDTISDSETVIVGIADIYTLTVLAENGCSASDQIEVTLDTNVPIADPGDGGTLDCEVSVITLGGSESSSGNNITYEWLDENNTVIAITSTTDVDLPGTYTLIVSDVSNNCSTSASIEIPQDIQVPIAAAGNNATLNCEVIEITLDGAQSSSGQNIEYQWLDSNNTVISDEITTLIDQPDTYTLIVFNTDNSCSSISTVIIDQNIDTPGADAGMDGVLNCNSNEVTLDGSASSGNNLSFEWQNESGAVVGDQSIIQVNQTGEFTLIVTNTESECTAQATAEVIPDDNLPTAVATPDGILTCENTAVTIDGSASTSVSGMIGFEWLDDQGNTISMIENASIDLPGDYTLIVTDTDNGCSISTTVTIDEDIEAPTADAGQNQVLTCSQTDVTLDGSGSSGQNLSFEWQDESGNTIATTAITTVMSGGTFVLFVTNGTNGCSNSASVEVMPDINLPTADAGTDEILTCDILEITLDGSNSSAGTNIEYEWQNSAGDVISTNQTTPITLPGTYTIIVLDTDNNCQSQDQVVISEDVEPPTPNIDFVSNQEIDCNNSSIVLDATGSAPFGTLSFDWSTDDGEILLGDDTPNPEMGQAGTYTLIVTNDENGCTALESIEITENLETPIVTINPPQILTCDNVEIVLNAICTSVGDFTFSWSTSNGNIISGQDTLIATVDQPGDFIITVINTVTGCETSTQTTVLQDITPPTAVANTDEQFDCITESITLDGDGSSIGTQFTYQWSGSTTIDNENSLNPTIYEAGNYTLEVTNNDNGCTESATILVDQNQNEPTAAEIFTVDPLCYGESGNISIISVTGGEAPLLYSIDGGETFSASNFFSSLNPGDYTVLIQDVNGCEFEQMITIEAATPIQVLVEPEVILELGQSYQIDAFSNIDTSEIAQIIWTPTEGLSCTNCLNPTIDTIQNEIQYTLTIIDENGCQATDQIMLRVDKTREVFIPNAFSPNDDGTNDIFLIFANNTRIEQVNTFQVFDRWGEQVYLAENFQANDPIYGWNGKLNEEKLNPAVFVYFAEIEFKDGVKIIYKGDVTLME